MQPVTTKDTVLDFGSGLGDLATYMRNNGYQGAYQGVELVPEFVDHSKEFLRKFKDIKFAGSLMDINDKKYDWSIISGVFNNKEAGGLSILFGGT